MIVINVISQNQDNIINYEMFNYKIRNKHIIGYSGSKEIFLGTYSNEEKCKEILIKMLHSYENGDKTYFMPQQIKEKI